MEKIKMITEAYSMQPITLRVYDESQYGDSDASSIQKIVLETGMEENTLVYVGYNFAGVKKFEYRSNSVNVTYF